jgi:cytochrome c
MYKNHCTLFFLFFLCLCTDAAAQKRVLIFSKTASFRHKSIEAGQRFLMDLGKKEGFLVDTTENSTKFNDENLKNYAAVIWLNTTGDVLNADQQADFERYIQAGGGYVGIHAASDTEYGWSWYNDLMGGYFDGHPGNPNVQIGKMVTLDTKHPASTHLPATFDRADEFYNFKSMKKENLTFLVEVKESSYKEGKMGDFHPMSWYHLYDGGKAFYTNFGHTDETFSEPLMMQHIAGGLKWAMADKLDYSKAHSMRPPEENRFERDILVSNLNEPTELGILPNGKVIFSERKGLLKMWNPVTKTTKIVARMPVYTKFEYGLMGVGIDPNYEKNNWIYLFYTPDETRDKTKDQFLSRFVYDDAKDTLVFASEKVVLRFPVKRDECCHTGGSIDWDKDGNMFLSSGDDTNPFASDGFAPIDGTAGREGWDARHTSSNTNDLRGKILRIKPTDDGGYTIPKGNLFEPSDKTRGEIYVMGCRNPYRISTDKRTGYLYWGDIGPDAGKADPNRGPDGIVEFNQARKPGYFGWPLFTGNNFAYNQYDFATKTSGEKFNPLKPINNSPHSTGLVELPPTQKAWIWYGYGNSAEFPMLGKGGANPMAGPVYYGDDYTNNARKFPKYFDGKFFAYEWMRDWILLVNMDKEGNYLGMEQFMPNAKFNHPMDMAFSKDGHLYVLDYGLNWFTQNEDAVLSKVEFNPGNRRPLAKVSSDKNNGSVPLTVAFSSKGTVDFDNDALKYDWNFGDKIPHSTAANPTVTFKESGEQNVTLTVTDALGNVATQNLKLKSGNTEPKIDIAIKSNKTFFLKNKKVKYAVQVTDKEDGNLKKGIDPKDVIVNINYLEGFDKTMIEQGHKANNNFVAGKRLIEASDCKGCHAMDKKSIGPSYNDIATKYPRSSANTSMLAEKIIKGGGGVWGEQAMAAHPQIPLSEAKDIADYILSLKDKRVKASLPMSSEDYTPTAHEGKKSGAYLVQATYTDKGGDNVGPITRSQVIALRSPIISAGTFDEKKNVSKMNIPGTGDIVIATEDNSYIAFNDMDLTDIKAISVKTSFRKGGTAGGTTEIRVGSPTGQLLGAFDTYGEMTAPTRVPLKKQLKGAQKLYFVFKNPKREGKPLLAISDIEFLTE